MLEIQEDERPDFLNLKSALPDYEVIKDYLYKLENGLLEEEEENEDSVEMNESLNNYTTNENF